MVFGHRIVMLSVMLAVSLRKLVEGGVKDPLLSES